MKIKNKKIYISRQGTVGMDELQFGEIRMEMERQSKLLQLLIEIKLSPTLQYDDIKKFREKLKYLS